MHIRVNLSLSAVRVYRNFFFRRYCDFRSGKVSANGQ